jgi:hypothetical protein
MTDVDELVYDRLSADETLLETLTGGVYFSDNLPREGLTQDVVPEAWDDDGFLKPCCVVKGRAVVPTNDIRDTENQLTSFRQVIECWLYDDGDAGYTALKEAANRIYMLLQDRPVTGAFSLTLDQQLKLPRAVELGNAVSLRLDYLSIAYKGTLV